jgi:dihydrofolate reductase
VTGALPRVALIAAVARNGVIGADQAMPWRLSSDLQRFKRLTLGKPVIMGRKTYASIGKPLAGRVNIVITRQGSPGDGVEIAADIPSALAKGRAAAEAGGVDEVFVIGGGNVYAQAIGLADRLYITHVDAAPEGDTHFPAIDPAVWKVVSSESVPAGERDSAATTVIIYDRVRADTIG